MLSYSDDLHMLTHAKRVGIQVIRTEDLPVPPEAVRPPLIKLIEESKADEAKQATQAGDPTADVSAAEIRRGGDGPASGEATTEDQWEGEGGASKAEGTN
jgi:hypothetical protein